MNAATVGAQQQTQQHPTHQPEGGTTMTSNGYSLDVESFRLYGDETTISFKVDHDLYVGCKSALSNGGGGTHPSQAGLVLIELGIDGDKMHAVRVERTGHFPQPRQPVDPTVEDDAPYTYPHDGAEVAMLEDAISALEAVRDQLLVMRTTAEVRDTFDALVSA